MSKGKDISGQRFGRLVAIEPLRTEKKTGVIWRCVCDCGAETEASAGRLTGGGKKSCGCLNKETRERADITGQRFGRLVAIRPDHVGEKRRAYYVFKCDCGNERVLSVNSVKWGGARSCGCLQKEHAGNLRKQDITGERFGRLTAVRPTEDRDASGSVIWECLCDCGNTAFYSVNSLNKGSARSCGCLYRETRPEASSYRKDLMEDTSLSSLASAKEPGSSNTSGYVGVSFNKGLGKWSAYIGFQKKRYYLGTFVDIADAISARKKAERELHGPIIMENWENMTPTTQRKFLENIGYELPVELTAPDQKTEDPEV